MPIYEYSCGKCGCEFEELATAEETVPCPSCGARETSRVMSAPARRPRGGESAGAGTSSGSGGCGGCSGGNCASCCH